jgi:hypothetical protein
LKGTKHPENFQVYKNSVRDSALVSEAVKSQAAFRIVSVRKGTAMAGAMTEEGKEGNGGLEEVQTPKENGEYFIYAQICWKFIEEKFVP